MGKLIALLLAFAGVVLIVLDLLVFNEPKASLKAGAVKVAIKGDQTMGTVSIIGAVCVGIALIAYFLSRTPHDD